MQAKVRPKCAACGKPAGGGRFERSIHRDGLAVATEVPLCFACGGHKFPTCEELWAMIGERRRAKRERKGATKR
jgi:hypothetical protein